MIVFLSAGEFSSLDLSSSASPTWDPLPALPHPLGLYSFAMAHDSDHILVFGGANATYLQVDDDNSMFTDKVNKEGKLTVTNAV